MAWVQSGNNFPEGIIPKWFVIARFEFELGYCAFVQSHASQYIIRTPSITLEYLKL